MTGGFPFYVQKIVICRHASVWHYGSEMESNKDILVLTEVSEGLKIRLTRLAKGLRQIDVASKANVQPIDITRLEKGRYVLPTHRKRILVILGMDDESD